MRGRLTALLGFVALALVIAQAPAAAGGRTRPVAAQARKPKPTSATRSVLIGTAKALGLQTERLGRGTQKLRRAILAKALLRARRADPRNTEALVRSLAKRFRTAETMRPKKQRVLLGFTRMIDAKASLDKSFFAQASKSLASESSKKQLLAMIDSGPRTKGKLMETPEQLMAAMVRHQLAGEGASLQLHITPTVAKWLDQQMRASGTATQRAVGGAAAFGANLATAFRELEVSFHTPGEISVTQAEAFAKGVKLISGRTGSKRMDPKKVANWKAPTKVNYIIETPANLAFSLFGQKKVRIDGKVRDTKVPTRGRIILSTQASHPPTFDPRLSDAALGRIAKAHDVFVAVGLHYLTAKPVRELQQQGRLLWRQLRTMKKANPALLVHYQYVSPKDPAKEWRAFASVNGAIDSMSLNTVELRGLAKNLNGRIIDRRRGPVRLKIPRRSGRESDEDPTKAFELGRQLMDALGLKRLHLHGFHADVILVRDANREQMQREGLAAMKGRQLGVNKVAAASGEIRSARDIFSVPPPLHPDSIAAVRKMAGFLAKKGEISANERESFVAGGAHVMKDGVGISVTPTHRLHSFRGGLVSLGDTLDLTTLFHAR